MNEDKESREEFSIPAFVGPLAWDEARKDLAPLVGIKPSVAGFLRFVGHPMRAGSLKRYASAYDEISQPEREFPLHIVPFEPQLLEKLFWPLRSAKVAYVLGNPLGTIALCGVIGEMVTVLTFDLECPWDDARQQQEFGSKFELLEQSKRIKELKKRKLILDDWVNVLTELGGIRRRYLHLFSQREERLNHDAVRAYRIALGLLSQRIGQRFDNGRLVLNDKVVEFLRKRGFVNATIETTGPPQEVHFEDFDEWPTEQPPKHEKE